jgi:lipoprotein-anchoring transpeptidase ErfK/SrfK
MAPPPSTASFRSFVALSIVCAAFVARAAAENTATQPPVEPAPELSNESAGPHPASMDAVRPAANVHPAPATLRPREAPVTDTWRGVAIVVYKSKRLLAIYRDGNFEKEFRVVLGLVPEGRKRFASDARTPEGFYHVTASRPHAKWQRFLALDYPNAEDRRRYAADVAHGKIPDLGGRPFDIGGDVGIHGNDREKDQVAGVDWTKGCIALAAIDIEAVAAMAPPGTPVWIVE